jgi:TrmH family RNA methyltransferase
MTDIITSLQNERVKLAFSLQNRPRARRKEKKITLEGVRLIKDVVQRGAQPEFVLYTPKDADYPFIAELQELRVKLIPVSDEVMAHVSDTQQPQGLVAVLPMPLPPLAKRPDSVLILDSIREPGNMGTILRSAAASGVEVVVLSPDCVDPYNPKVLRAGMGAHWRVPVLELQWFEIGHYVDKMPVYVAAGDAQTRYTAVDFSQRWALVIGSEAFGASNARKLGETLDIAIPMAGDTESLNAAMAASIILFEAQRQRLSASSDKK